MTVIRKALGFLALTALAVGMVCGVLGKGSDTVAWWWLTGAVMGGVWGFLKWAQNGDRVRDPVTLPPRYDIEDLFSMRTEPPLIRTTKITTPHGDTTFRHPYQTPEHRATWPHEIGAPE